jgi:hypothetical protein
VGQVAAEEHFREDDHRRAHIRGAYGLSGIGVLPTKEELVVQLTALVEAHARAFLLLPPHPAITTDNMSIKTNRPIFSMKSPFVGTVIETDRRCPQLDDWLCLSEASVSGLTSADCYHVEEKFLKVNGLMERVQKSRKTMEALNRATTPNGKGLEKATLDRALDRLIKTMDGVNRELDDLLAKAKR